MKTIKELFTEAGVTEQAGLITDIERLLTTAESKNTGGIPKARFNEVIEQRNDLKSDIEELNGKIKTLEGKAEKSEEKLDAAKGVQDELDTYKKKSFNESKDIWIGKAKLFTVKEDDKNFDKIEKIKGDFTFKEKPEEYTEKEIAQNIVMLKPYEKIGYFGDTYKVPDLDDDRSKAKDKDKKGKSPFDAFPTK